ncbi:MAG: ABC transporter [Leptospiraceae bacterium]|nr:MAG: ABC transporter [Leptospiraceae bacterium]
MNDNNFISGTFSRLFRLGETAGRIGYAFLKNFGSYHNIDLDQIIKAVDTLSRLKGAPMKVGQMLSLHEDLLPPEIIEIFKVLQKDSPPMPFSTVKTILEQELKEKLSDFDSIEEKPFASASIGQVHKATLKTKEKVILKIQYPGIRKSIQSDLTTIKLILSPLFKALEIPFDPVWEEIRERLLEEVDYIHELNNLKTFHQFVSIPGLVFPIYFGEYSTTEVLTLSFEESYNFNEVTKHSQYQEYHESWIYILLKLIIFGLFRYKILHVDPNSANFGFRENQVILYDFGCIKKVPNSISIAYKKTAYAILNHEWDKASHYLFEAGIKTKDNQPLSEKFLKPHLEIIEEIFPDKETYFGEDSKIYQRLLQIARDSWKEAKDIIFPKDLVFIHRNLIGHFGNLRKLRVKKNWRKVFLELLDQTNESEK